MKSKILKNNFQQIVLDCLPAHITLEQVEIWFQDESRVGQQGSQTRLWTKRGTRPRVVKQQQFLSSYVYGAVCPSERKCAAVVLPLANAHGLEEHLNEISANVEENNHAVVVMDKAGWHTSKKIKVPENITIIYLPAYSPELNPQEQVWQYLKDNFLANRVFKDVNDIIDACCMAWNKFAESKDIIQTLTQREWAVL